MHPDTLLALYMNGEPLPFKHEFPVRLIVPGWYGMASVKWLRRIIVLDRHFTGPFQTRDYVLLDSPDAYKNAQPVTVMPVNSSIAKPIDQEMLRRGEHLITGVGWAGTTDVVSIQVSTDGGLTWKHAQWLDPIEKYSWRRWVYVWHERTPGEYQIMACATDSQGHTQLLKAPWNVKGYMNNSIHTIRVYVE